LADWLDWVGAAQSQPDAANQANMRGASHARASQPANTDLVVHSWVILDVRVALAAPGRNLQQRRAKRPGICHPKGNLFAMARCLGLALAVLGGSWLVLSLLWRAPEITLFTQQKITKSTLVGRVAGRRLTEVWLAGAVCG
jgi:hypothetical protein